MNREWYLWRAWNANRERICDAGVCRASDLDDAKYLASIIAGGPHRYTVVEFEVEKIND